jgi:hypothetical protein
MPDPKQPPPTNGEAVARWLEARLREGASDWILGALLATFLAMLSVVPAQAQLPPDYVPFDDENAAYYMGVNRQFAERFRTMQEWGCGDDPGSAWCRDAKQQAPAMERASEHLAERFAKLLSDKGLLEADQPSAFKKRLMQTVVDGAIDVARCFSPVGQYQYACEQLEKRCAAAGRIKGLPPR